MRRRKGEKEKVETYERKKKIRSEEKRRSGDKSEETRKISMEEEECQDGTYYILSNVMALDLYYLSSQTAGSCFASALKSLLRHKHRP